MGDMGPNQHTLRSGMVVTRTTLTIQSAKDRCAFHFLLEETGLRPHMLARELAHEAMLARLEADPAMKKKFEKVWAKRVQMYRENEAAFYAERQAEERRQGFTVIEGGRGSWG